MYIGIVGINNVITPGSIPVPKTFEEAMVSPHFAEWLAVAKKEHRSLLDLNVFELLSLDDVPPRHSIIGSRWVFKLKTDWRFEGRLVTTGWSERHGISCGGIFVSIGRIESQQLLFAIATVKRWSVAAMDCSTVFLNGKLSDEVYMRKENECETKNSRGQPIIMKLRKSIYGLR